MLRILNRTEIDNSLWDACIRKSHNSKVYGYSWYIDLFADDWIGIVKGNYESVMPLPVRKKYLIDYIYTPYYIQQLGIFSVHALTAEEIEVFIDHIPSKYRLI